MSTRVVERVDDWDSRSFTGGYHDLHDLAEREFSGVVRAGGGDLFMTGGTVVGLRDATMDDFEDTSGTVYEAPDPALPLLAVMQQMSEEVRAKYYTEDTPISEVDTTLSDGGFSGYIELSENVLSGDYYIVYHGGESMAVAYVGESRKLLTDREAFETADDEVGIYEVRPVEIEPVDIPEPASDPSEADDGQPSGGAPEETADTDDDEVPTEPATAQPADAEPDEPAESPAAPAETPSASVDEQASTEAGERQARAGDDQESPSQSAETQPTEPEGSAAAVENDRPTEERQATGEARSPETRSGESDRPRQPASQSEGRAGGYPAGRDTGHQASDTTDHSSHQTDAGALETQTIPSLDPARTTDMEPATAAADTKRGSQSKPDRQQAPATQEEGTKSHTSRSTSQPSQSTPSTAADRDKSGSASAGASERVKELEREVSDREEEIDRLKTEIADLEGERDGLRAELEQVRSERDKLQSEIEELKDELARVESEYDVETEAERRLTAAEALAGTDIFVRYHSKGQATLEKAHAGNARKEDVTENLRLENHTQFDATNVSVTGSQYGEFLESRHEFQFVKWVVKDLLFEIRDTGQADSLKDLYDAIPQVDRAELDGMVKITYTENGQETRTEESFDVILRDRMGNPLMVANFNDSREGATESMMSDLVTAAERVGKGIDSFSCAFLITRSFFEPGALETASEATRSGLLSRDKRKSFVNLSRKQGYHLCLVEARNENFHLAVPEL